MGRISCYQHRKGLTMGLAGRVSSYHVPHYLAMLMDSSSRRVGVGRADFI